MKNYRTTIAALVLSFVFSTSAFADGILHTEKTPPPPPQATGVIWTDRTTTQADDVLWTEAAPSAPEEDALTEITLSLLQTLTSLL